jgi:hypothetical protein
VIRRDLEDATLENHRQATLQGKRDPVQTRETFARVPFQSEFGKGIGILKSSELQAVVLKAISTPGVDTRLGGGRHYVVEAIHKLCSQDNRPSQHQIFEAFWSLVAQGLAFIDISQSAPENWSLHLTEAGKAAVRDELPNPDDPSGYLFKLFKAVPDLNKLVRLYAEEAINAYYRRCYLSCTVMIGVAAEAACIDLATSFALWQGTRSAEKLKKILENPHSNYIEKFLEFRKRLEPEKNRMPSELRDGLDVHLGSVLDLLRMSRNDAGHPTGKTFNRDDCFTSLVVFARLLKIIYALKHYFDSNAG